MGYTDSHFRVRPMTDKALWREQMVARYVKGELHGEELEAFEADYFEHPHVMEMIEQERALRAGMKALAPAAAAHAGDRWRPLALAASLVAAVLLVANVAQYQGGTTTQRAAGDTLEIRPMQTAWLLSQRGAPGLLSIETLDAPLALQIELAGNYAGSVGVVLVGEHGRTLWSAETIMPDQSGNLTLLLPPASLAGQQLTLKIQGNGDNESSEQFEFGIATTP